jgi:hypothetical protein
MLDGPGAGVSDLVTVLGLEHAETVHQHTGGIL